MEKIHWKKIKRKMRLAKNVYKALLNQGILALALIVLTP